MIFRFCKTDTALNYKFIINISKHLKLKINYYKELKIDNWLINKYILDN